MKTWMIATALAAAAAALAGGCNPSQKSFQVSVRNDTQTPVTLWLTKDGPPAEVGWLSPEQLASDPEHASYDLAFVPPGRTGSTPKMTGNFPSGTHAVLRVYKGEKELFYILQDAKAGTEQRTDYVLKPGANRLAVEEQPGGKLVVQKAK
jgi:hypothetical protein